MSARLADRKADCEIAVIGGGVAGGTLAAILGAAGIRVALAESTPSVVPAVIAYNICQSIELLAASARLLADKAIAGFSVNHARLNQALELTDLSEEDLARLLDPAQLTQGGIRK